MKSPQSILLRALLQVALLGLTLLLTGCVGAIPFPRFPSQGTYGTKLRAEDIAFIRIGATSASELFGTLGTNCLCAPRQRALAFPWELPGGSGIWWWCSMYGGKTDTFEWSRWRAFFVAFDTNNVVTAIETKHLSSGKSLHEQLDHWATKHHAAPNHLHPDIFIAKDP